MGWLFRNVSLEKADFLDRRVKKPDKLTIVKIALRSKQEKQNVPKSFFR